MLYIQVQNTALNIYKTSGTVTLFLTVNPLSTNTLSKTLSATVQTATHVTIVFFSVIKES